jgi:hypothetical protein
LRDTAFLSIRESVKNFLIDDFLKYKQRNNNTVMKYLYTNTLTGVVKIIFFHFSLVSLSLDVWFWVELGKRAGPPRISPHIKRGDQARQQM